MTKTEFADAVRILCQRFNGSVTSWGRTVARNQRVGGKPGSAHIQFLGADVVWDDIGWTPMPADAEAVGLSMLIEKDHTHFQPLGWRPSQR